MTLNLSCSEQEGGWKRKRGSAHYKNVAIPRLVAVMKVCNYKVVLSAYDRRLPTHVSGLSPSH